MYQHPPLLQLKFFRNSQTAFVAAEHEAYHHFKLAGKNQVY
jgi:hypothetical protein